MYPYVKFRVLGLPLVRPHFLLFGRPHKRKAQNPKLKHKGHSIFLRSYKVGRFLSRLYGCPVGFSLSSTRIGFFRYHGHCTAGWSAVQLSSSQPSSGQQWHSLLGAASPAVASSGTACRQQPAQQWPAVAQSVGYIGAAGSPAVASSGAIWIVVWGGCCCWAGCVCARPVGLAACGRLRRLVSLFVSRNVSANKHVVKQLFRLA